MAKRDRIRKTIRIGGKRVSAYFSTRAMAEAWHRKMQTQKDAARAGLDLQAEDVFLKHYAAKFILAREKTEKHCTFVNDEGRMRLHIIPKFGDRLIKDITATEWEEHLKELVANGMSKSTSNRVRALISKMYNSAMREKPPVVRENPIRLVKPYDERKGRIAKIKSNFWHTLLEVETYLNTAREEDPGYWIYVLIGCNSGLRDSQKIPLQWRDVDWRNRVLRVSRSYMRSNDTVNEGSKGWEAGEEYVVGINDTLFEALKWWKENTPFKQLEDYICVQTSGSPGDHFYSWHIRKAHARICKRALVKQITPHGVRHSYATHYLEQGGRMEDLQKMLGHKDISTTQIYTHVIPATMKEKANVLNLGTAKPGLTTVTEVSPKLKIVKGGTS